MNGAKSSKQYQILCIDDEPSNLMLRKLVLQSAGFSVLAACSGKEGIDLFSSNPVDALVIDFSMPDMDGGMVAVRIKELKPRIPVIMLSAYPGAQEGLDDAVDLFIEKGGDPKKLIRRIEALVKIRDHSHPELNSDYVVFVEPSRQIVDCSNVAGRLVGYTRMELLNKTLDQISYEPEDVPGLFEQYQQRKALEGEHILKHKSGRPIAVRFRSWVFPDGCMAAICDPVTDWKELYRCAMLELDPAKLKNRVEVALLAIHRRMRQLEQTPAKMTSEAVALNDALNGLRVLQKGA
ncbi:MAG TPA: response regulator [Candidatus Dormibacteraeota bacterium]|nr:response regulator [Candidatus Dormibacteraeota bacterium]